MPAAKGVHPDTAHLHMDHHIFFALALSMVRAI